MGTTNTGCILTGLEIAEGDQVYFFMLHTTPDPREGHAITLPPLKGTYDGVMGIYLTEDLPSLGLKVGDRLPQALEKTHKDDARLFVHPDIFDTLRTTVYDEDGDTFGDTEDKGVLQLRNALADREKLDARGAELKADPQVIEAWLVARSLYAHPYGTWSKAHDVFLNALNTEDLLEDALMLFGRGRRLLHASVHLRQPLVPFTGGPQEVSDTARIAVYDLAASVARKRQEANE